MNIIVHIDRLILDGLSVQPSQRSLLQAAVEAELIHLLATNSLKPELLRGVFLPSVQADDIILTHEIEPNHLGRQIAHSVYGGISQ